MASALVCNTLPKTTLSTSSRETLDWASAAFAAWTARSVADTSLSEPPYVPKGVRFAARKTISVGMGFIQGSPYAFAFGSGPSRAQRAPPGVAGGILRPPRPFGTLGFPVPCGDGSHPDGGRGGNARGGARQHPAR